MGRYREAEASCRQALTLNRRRQPITTWALHLAPDSAPVLRKAVIAFEAIDRRDRVLALLRNAPSGLLHELDRHPDLAASHEDPQFKKLIGK